MRGKEFQAKLAADLTLLAERLRFLQDTLEDLSSRVSDLEEQWEAGEMPLKPDFEDWED